MLRADPVDLPVECPMNMQCPVEDLLLFVFVALVCSFVIFVPSLCALCVYARVSVCVQAM